MEGEDKADKAITMGSEPRFIKIKVVCQNLYLHSCKRRSASYGTRGDHNGLGTQSRQDQVVRQNLSITTRVKRRDKTYEMIEMGSELCFGHCSEDGKLLKYNAANVNITDT